MQMSSGAQASLCLQAIAGTKLVHFKDSVDTLPVILLFHSASIQASPSQPDSTQALPSQPLYHPM